MTKLLLSFLLAGMNLSVAAQQLKGQWKGYFEDISVDSDGVASRYEYVLELESKEKQVSGYSYTYFTQGGKRFYSICRVQGFIDPKSRYLEVKEVSRTKTNVPASRDHCLQVHKLYYDSKPQPKIIKGQWIPASNSLDNDCGYGVTWLSWRPVENISHGLARAPIQRNQTTKSPVIHSSVAARKNDQTKNHKEISANTFANRTEKHKPLPNTFEIQRIESSPDEILSIGLKDDAYRKRNLHLQKTIRVSSDFVTLSIYDNGEIDGDSISVYFNGNQILKNKRLTDKPIQLHLPITAGQQEHELVLFAENLGSIPPNTALMIVADGSKRYEVRVSCDLQRNAVIHFVKEAN